MGCVLKAKNIEMNIIIITTKANWVKYVIIKKNATVINESNPNFVLINY